MHLDSNLAVELNRRLGSHRTDSHIYGVGMAYHDDNQ